MNTPPPLGTCLCGHPSWILTDGAPNHPCCVDNGITCEPCRISRSARRKRRS